MSTPVSTDLIRDELVAYLNTLGLDALEPEEVIESAEGILEWGLEKYSFEGAVSTCRSYAYSLAESMAIVKIVHKLIKPLTENYVSRTA